MWLPRDERVRSTDRGNDETYTLTLQMTTTLGPYDVYSNRPGGVRPLRIANARLKVMQGGPTTTH